MRLNKSFALLALLLLSACAEAPERLTLKPTAFMELNDWYVVDHSGALAAFQNSCTVILKKNASDSLGPQMGFAGDWQPACNAALQIDSKGPNRLYDSRNFFETYFVLLKSISDRKPDGLFTGYYEIELNGSLKKTSKYRYPVYSTPPEYLRTLTRSEIDSGVLEGKGLELLWVDDPVRLFFMHVQGSGIVHLKDGKMVRLNYDAQNGQPYVSLGRWLIDNNYMTKEQVNAPAIKEWLYQHPELADCAMHQNPSYVYFRIREEAATTEGPIGAQTIPLSPYRSAAIDKRFYGYGIPVWIETNWPDYENQPQRPLRQLMIAQDTGGAIRGAIRADIFFGRGEYAEKLAGYMNERGNLWILLPKQVAANVKG